MLDNPQSLAGVITKQRAGVPAERHHIEGALRAPFDAVESIVEGVVGP